jgi:TrmH family RNA methyltransferase
MAEHLSKNQIKWVRSLQQKKHRDGEGVFVAEGHKCVEELRGAFELVLMVTPDNATEVEIAQMSNLRTPQGVIGVFKRRGDEAKGERQKARGEELVVALDGVQDPGNLGTIIRTCDWFGVHDIYCSKDTADCYNPKVVQATMGALARVRVHYINIEEYLQQMREAGVPIYGTLLEGGNMYKDDAIADKQKGVIIMGSEGNGISPAIKELITHNSS